MSKLEVRKLKVGIIGLGVGEVHIAGYNSHRDCAVSMLCDISKSKLTEVAKKYPNLKTTENPNEILNDPEIDVVSIASYDNCHYEQIVQAIQNGKHVFVEKPLCLYFEEAKEIRSLLENKPNLKLSSNLILRKSPRFIKLKEMVSAGQFGKMFYAEGDYHYGRLEKITEGWRGQLPFYSVVYGGSVHLIDLMLWLTTDMIEEVAAYGNQIVSKGSQFHFNDCVVSILKFKSGMVAKVTADFGGVRPHFHDLSIYGTKATFVNDFPNAKLFLSRDPKQQPQKITEPYPGVQKGDLIYNFIDSIANGVKPEISAEDVFKAMSVCFAIEESVKQGKPVRVNYL